MGDIINNPDFNEEGSTIEEAKQQESEDTQVETSNDQETESVEKESEEETSKESSEEEQSEEEKETEESQEEEGTDESKTDDVEESEVEGLQKQKDKLSDDIVKLRKQRRTLRGDDTQVVPPVQPKPTQPPIQETEGEDDFLPDEKKRLDKYLTKRDSVRDGKEAKDIEQDELDTFLDKHPEYDNDNLWEDFQGESKLYARPVGVTSSEARRHYKNVFARIHKTLSGDSTTTSTQDISEQKDRIKKASQGSGGGGSATQSSTSKKGLPENLRHNMSGFSNEDFDDMN